jgi:hypothetical protein
MFFDECDDFGECFRIMDSYIRQRFPIEGDLRPFQTSHEFAIGEPVEARCRIDTYNPELAKIALAGFAVMVRKLPAAFDGLTRPPVELPPGSPVAPCMVEQTLMAPRCDWTTGRSWHDLFPSKQACALSRALRQAGASLYAAHLLPTQDQYGVSHASFYASS